MKINPFPGYEDGVRLYTEDLPDEEAQKLVKNLVGAFDCPDDVVIDDIEIDGPDEGQKLELRIMKLKDAAVGSPVIIDFHGGGWVAGHFDGDNARNVALLKGTPAIVVAPNYRLSNEAVHYPAPLEDALCVYQWVLAHASEFGGDAGNVAVYGTSAGGNIAAGLQLKLRDSGLRQPRLTVLNCPALSLGTCASKKYFGTIGNSGTPFHRMAEYVYCPPDGQLPSYYAFPGLCHDLGGLGPVYIVAGEYDPLRDDGLEYGCRLLDAGVQCELHVVSGVSHGFCGNVDHPLTRYVVRGICGSLRRAFGMETLEY